MNASLCLRSPRGAAGGALLFTALLALASSPATAQLSLPPDYAWRQLSPPGEAGSSVRFLWQMDRRGEWVVFVGDVENTGAEAVYSRRRNGAELHRLSPYGPVGAVQSLELSADGRFVIYRGDLETAGLDELWSAPISGTPASAVKLNLPVTGEGVSGSTMPAAAEAASATWPKPSPGRGFWSVPVDGPAAASVRLDFELGADELVYGGLVVSDNRIVLVIYNFTTTVHGRSGRCHSPGQRRPASTCSKRHRAGCYAFLVSASSATNRLAYALTCDTPVGDRTNQLWSVPMAGPASESVSLGGSFVEGGAIQAFSTSPDGLYLVVRADKLVDERFELWSVPIAGPAGAMVRLNPALVADGDVTNFFEISPDSSLVAYVADQGADEAFRAWSVPIAGPSAAAEPLVSRHPAAGADVTNLEFTPDSTTIVLRGDLSVSDRFDLYSVPADGSAFQDRITNDARFRARSTRSARPGASIPTASASSMSSTRTPRTTRAAWASSACRRATCRTRG